MRRHHRLRLTAAALLCAGLAACSQDAGTPAGPGAPDSGQATTATDPMTIPFTPPTPAFATSTAWTLSGAAGANPALAGQQWLAGSSPVQVAGVTYLLTTDTAVTAADTPTGPVTVRVVTVGPGTGATAPVAVSDPIDLLPGLVSFDSSGSSWLTVRGFAAGHPDLTVIDTQAGPQVVLVAYTGTSSDAPQALTARPVTAGGGRVELGQAEQITGVDVKNPWAWNPSGGDLFAARTDGTQPRRLYPAATSSSSPLTSGDGLLASVDGGQHTVTGARVVPDVGGGFSTQMSARIKVDGKTVALPPVPCGALGSPCEGLEVGAVASGQDGVVIGVWSSAGGDGLPSLATSSVTWAGKITSGVTVRTKDVSHFPNSLTRTSMSGRNIATADDVGVSLSNLRSVEVPAPLQDSPAWFVTDDATWALSSGNHQWSLYPTSGQPTRNLPKETNVPLGVAPDGTGVFVLDARTRMRVDGGAAGDILFVPPAN